MSHRTLLLADPSYPERLRALASPPPAVTVAGDFASAASAVAIVGTREPSLEAAQFAFDLAAALSRAGAVIVSGGAAGIDAAAHRGALSTGGRTWAVAATGRNHCFPREHAELFDRIADGPGAMVWPFPDGLAPMPGNFLRRNGVLVALADALVIVQAGAPSGSINAFAWAQKLARPFWAVPGPPWDPTFTGCRIALDGGARVVTSIGRLLKELGLPNAQLTLALSSETKPPAAPPLPAPRLEDPTDQAIWAACATTPKHIDEIAENARVCVSTALTRLLTLALENVLVEGPEGFYRRCQ